MRIVGRVSSVVVAGLLALCLVASAEPPKPAAKVNRVLIKKGAHTMELLAGEESRGVYRVAIGPGGVGHKHREGDKVTPVGRYHVISRGPSAYTVFMRLDYPNAEDRKRFAELKAKGALPWNATIGGDIGVHGSPPQAEYKAVHKDFDWTLGCIAVDDDEIKDVAKQVPDGTVVDIEDLTDYYRPAMLPEKVEEKLAHLPLQPGVYLFKDDAGAILYVGKAKSLRSRVRSYFQAQSSDQRSFIPILRETISDLDTVVTQTEKEAAILENNLIKEHHPRYNVKLRDDKEYLSLRLPTGEEWPRLYLVRRPTQDGARYFGPYRSATAARRTLHLINKHFQLRTCSDAELARRKRPCLQHQIKRCPAPCVFDVDRRWYGEQVEAVAKFLDGRHRELSSELEAKMRSAAAATKFELAVVYRDQLSALEKVREEQRVVSVDDVDRDVIGIFREGDMAEIALLCVRAGKLANVTTFSLKGVEIPDEEVVSAFLAQHYGDAAPEIALIPDEIVVPELPEAESGIREWLAERAGHAVAIVRPARGRRAQLLAMAAENAKHAWSEKRRAKDDVAERLAQIQERLRLPTLPRRIECTDISHLGGGDTVGSVVGFLDGEPDKKRYRTYHVRGAVPSAALIDAAGDDGPRTARAGDDYAAMYEVLSRRFRRAATGTPEEAAEWELPDLFVVDGGRGQLGVALAAARDLGLHDLSIVALAKEKENVAGDTLVDRVYLPGQKNPIPVRGPLVILARARDEAHRFANKGREKRGKERRLRSQLDDVKGIGPVARKALLRVLGSLAAVRAADDATILAVPGITPRHLKALRQVFRDPSPR